MEVGLWLYLKSNAQRKEDIRCESEFCTKTHDKCAPMTERCRFALKSSYERVGVDSNSPYFVHF